MVLDTVIYVQAYAAAKDQAPTYPLKVVQAAAHGLYELVVSSAIRDETREILVTQESQDPQVFEDFFRIVWRTRPTTVDAGAGRVDLTSGLTADVESIVNARICATHILQAAYSVSLDTSRAAQTMRYIVAANTSDFREISWYGFKFATPSQFFPQLCRAARLA